MVVVLFYLDMVAYLWVFSIHMSPKNTSDWCQDWSGQMKVISLQGLWRLSSSSLSILLSFQQVLFYSFLSACSINIPLVFQGCFQAGLAALHVFPLNCDFFFFFSSLMIFSLCIMGLKLVFVVLSFCRVLCIPHFLCGGVVVDVVLDVFLPCVFSLISRPFFLQHFLSHPSPLSVCPFLWCAPPLPSRPSQKDHGLPSRTNSGLSFLLLCFSRLPPRRVQLLSVCRTLVQEQFTQNWKLIYHLENLGLAND